MIRTKKKSGMAGALNGRAKAVGKHLVIDPRVCHGQMTFRGTRVPVETILVYLAKGRSLEYIRKSWPEVPLEGITEAIALAAKSFLRQHGKGRS
jgi:uncharacterized protein (DUF433 family)